MRRREFVTLLGGGLVATAAGLRGAYAQEPMPLVGFLNTASPRPFAHLVDAFRSGLNRAGYLEGRNISIEYRWAEGRYDLLPGFAAELVRRPVTVLAATGGEPAILAAMAATSTIPIVFATGADPVARGFVTSLNRPDRNVTGATQLTLMLGAKRLGLLRDLVPTADVVGLLVNPTFAPSATAVQNAQEAAARLGVRLVVLHASTASEIDSAFAALAAAGAGALIVGADPFFNSRRNQLVALAARQRIPTMYEFREYALSGGLVSYGTNLADAYRQVGDYVGRILNGAKPSDLPVTQSDRFEFVINLKTARDLGIEVPPGLSAHADEVIE